MRFEYCLVVVRQQQAVQLRSHSVAQMIIHSSTSHPKVTKTRNFRGWLSPNILIVLCQPPATLCKSTPNKIIVQGLQHAIIWRGSTRPDANMHATNRDKYYPDEDFRSPQGKNPYPLAAAKTSLHFPIYPCSQILISPSRLRAEPA